MWWYIWSFEHRQWWRADHCGYTPRLAEAGLYNSDAACSIISRSVQQEEIPVAEAEASNDRWPATTRNNRHNHEDA